MLLKKQILKIELKKEILFLWIYNMKEFKQN